MGSGYANDQFYGIGAAGEDVPQVFGRYVIAADNPAFIYPDREVRVVDSSGKEQLVKMQRGYIRSMITNVQGAPVSIRKCAFQFNPQLLQTSVQMNQDVLNAYQQDVSQFAVPLAANSNFVVNLMFDRSMELNNGSRDPFKATDIEGSQLYLDQSPEQIGVFRDIGELNAIIGAGITPQLKDLAVWNAKQQITAEGNRLAAANGGTALPADAARVQAALSKSADTTTGLLSNANYGNSAFLMPLPVRAVFSSLFIVEGFVNNVDITYSKFTTQMVPMQAYVNLSMSATYVGYAKKNTYTSISLAQQSTEFTAQQDALVATQRSVGQAIRSVGSSAEIHISFYDNYFDLENKAAQSPRLTPLPPPNSLPLSDLVGHITGAPSYTYLRFPKALKVDGTLNDKDPVIAASDISPVTFDTTTTVSIFGPFHTVLSGSTSGTPIRVYTFQSSGASWDALAPGVRSDALRAAPVIPGTDDIWMIKWEVVSTATVDATAIVGRGSYTSSTTSSVDFKMDMVMGINWTGDAIVGTTPPGGNSSSSSSGGSTPPGSTSSVGKKPPEKAQRGAG